MNDNRGISGFFEKVIDVLGLDTIGELAKAKAYHVKLIDEYKAEKNIELRNHIIENSDLNDIQKLQLSALIGSSLNKFQRKMEILGIAIDNIDKDVDPDNIDSDWLVDFFEKASLITDKDIQIIWGKLLANATADKNLCSKTLLNSLFLMGNEEIVNFRNLTQFCISEMSKNYGSDKILSYPILYYSSNVDEYETHGLSRLKLNKLASLGLIELNFEKEFVFKRKKIRLIYNNKVIELHANDKVKIGNVTFTYDGFLLYDMTEKIYNNRILDMNVEIWKRRGYKVYINK